MAQGDITFYNNFKQAVLDGNAPDLDDAGTTIKVALVESHTPDIDAHEFWDDVSADEISGTGYTAGGEEITAKSVTQDNTNDVGTFDGGDITWTALDAGTPSHGIIYVDTGVAGTSLLIGYIEIGVASNGFDYKIEWNANGIFRLA